VVVEREVNGTNKTTQGTERRAVFESSKKDLARADIVIALGKAWKRRNRG
jgi:hypothetical protein